MKKKIFTSLFAVCFVLPVSLALAACGKIKQPSQEEMYSIYSNAIKTEEQYTGSWSFNGSLNSTVVKNGQTNTENTTIIETYNSENKEYVSAELVNNEAVDYTITKRLPDGTFQKWDDHAYSNYIVDEAYVVKNYSNDYLEDMLSDLGDTYSEVITTIQEAETSYKTRYSKDGYSYSEIKMSINFEKISKTEYKYVFSQILDINTPEDDGEKYRRRQVSQYTYTFDEDNMKKVDMSYEYHYWTFDATTNQQTDYSSTVQNGGCTLVKSYDTTAMGKVDLTGKTVPTNKIKQTLILYLDGQQRYYTNTEFGTDIDTIISQEIEARGNCSLGKKYLDKDSTVEYVAGSKTSSTETTTVYIYSKPNDGYAIVNYKYYEKDDDETEYSLTNSKILVYPANHTIELEPIYNSLVFNEIVKKDGQTTTEKSLTVENQKIYTYEFYRTETDQTCGDVTVYMNGELTETFTNNEYTDKDESVLEFIDNHDHDIIYKEYIYLCNLDYEVYLDANYTQKVDNFTKLGAEDINLYIKLIVASDKVLVTFEDNDYTEFDYYYSGYYDAESLSTVISIFDRPYYKRGDASVTINGVDITESPYAEDGENGYILNLELGQEYVIVITPTE